MFRRLPLIAVAAAALVAVSGLPAQAEAPGEIFPDVTPPTITFEAPPGAWEGWYSHPVDVKVRALDSGSGIDELTWTLTGVQTGTGKHNPATLSINQPGVTTISATAADFEGNAATATYGVGIDPHAPIVTLAGSAVDGMVVAKGAARMLSYTCVDALTGIRLCAGDVASGAFVPTDTIGQKTVEVWGIDKVDNRTTRSITYTVVESELHTAAAPTITGTPRVGQTLTVGGAAFTPAAESVTYRWLRSGEVVGTGSSYTLTQADRGRAMSVLATGRRAGYADGVAGSVPTGEVLDQLFTITGQSVLQGTAAVGSTLRVVLPMIVPAPAETRYYWSRDGVLVGDVTGAEYPLAPVDAGARISVQVWIEKPAYQGTWLETPASATVQASELAVSRPTKVVGPATVGQTLRVTVPVFAPAATAVTYQWLRDGDVIQGARAASYKLTGADVGRRIAVRVVGTRAQYAATISDAVTAKVVRATPNVVASAKARGKKKVRIVVGVTASGVLATGRVTIKRGSKVVATRALTNGRATIDLARQKKGKAAYTVVYSGSGSVDTRSVRTRTIAVR